MCGGPAHLPPAHGDGDLRTGLDRNGVTEERKAALLDKVFTYFPVLASGPPRDQAGGTFRGGEQQMLAIAPP